MATATRQEVYAAIDTEREYQEQRWQRPAHNHSLLEYTVFIRDYAEQIMHLESRNDQDAIASVCLAAMRKITALGVAAMEQHGAPKRTVRKSELFSGLSRE